MLEALTQDPRGVQFIMVAGVLFCLLSPMPRRRGENDGAIAFAKFLAFPSAAAADL